MSKLEDKDFYIFLGSRIKSRRKELGFSQADVAKHLGISYQQMQKYESGKDKLRVLYLSEIAGFLDTKAAILIGEELYVN